MNKSGNQRHGDGFAGLGGDSVYQEAPVVISRGSWWLCTPSPVVWINLPNIGIMISRMYGGRKA